MEAAEHYNYFRDYDPAIGRYVESDPIGLRGGANTFAYVGSNPARQIDPYGLVRWGDVANNALGMLGAGAGFIVGGALVAAPTGISQVLGALVLGKSAYSMGVSSYNFARAFSDDGTYDVPSVYQSLPRAMASAISSCPPSQRFADVAELGLDFASGRVVAGFVRNPSGFLRSPVGYPPLNSSGFMSTARFNDFAPKDVVRYVDIMQGAQSVQYARDGWQ